MRVGELGRHARKRDRPCVQERNARASAKGTSEDTVMEMGAVHNGLHALRSELNVAVRARARGRARPSA